MEYMCLIANYAAKSWNLMIKKKIIYPRKTHNLISVYCKSNS